MGAIVTIGKAKTLWEIMGRTRDILNLVKVDGDGYVSYSKRRPGQVSLRTGPCLDITLGQLISTKDSARKAVLEVAEALRL